MWLSQFVELLKPARSSSHSPRRAGRSRPLAVEPLEDRLLMTGQVDSDVAAGTKTRQKPKAVMTFVLEVAVNWLGPNWSGVGTAGAQPESGQPDGGRNTHSGFKGGADLSALGLSSLSALVVPTPGTDFGGAPRSATTALPVAADAGPVTPAKIDTFFQQAAAVGSL